MTMTEYMPNPYADALAAMIIADSLPIASPWSIPTTATSFPRRRAAMHPRRDR